MRAVAFGYIVAGTGNYDLPVVGVAAMMLVSAGLFAAIDCTRGLAEVPPAAIVPQPA